MSKRKTSEAFDRAFAVLLPDPKDDHPSPCQDRPEGIQAPMPDRSQPLLHDEIPDPGVWDGLEDADGWNEPLFPEDTPS